jgi:hypothetical protein
VGTTSMAQVCPSYRHRRQKPVNDELYVDNCADDECFNLNVDNMVAAHDVPVEIRPKAGRCWGRSSSVDGSLQECRGWYRKRHKIRNCRTSGHGQRRQSERCNDMEPPAIGGGDEVGAGINCEDEECAIVRTASSVDHTAVDEGVCSDVIVAITAPRSDDDDDDNNNNNNNNNNNSTVVMRQKTGPATDVCAAKDDADAMSEAGQHLGLSAAEEPCDVSETQLGGMSVNDCSTVTWEVPRRKTTLTCSCGPDDDQISQSQKETES